MQPRGREGKGGEEEREKGEFLNPFMKKKCKKERVRLCLGAQKE